MILVDLEVVERAWEIVVGHPRLTARNAIHVAIMRAHSIDHVLSFDRHYDGLPGITRIA